MYRIWLLRSLLQKEHGKTYSFAQTKGKLLRGNSKGGEQKKGEEHATKAGNKPGKPNKGLGLFHLWRRVVARVTAQRKRNLVHWSQMTDRGRSSLLIRMLHTWSLSSPLRDRALKPSACFSPTSSEIEFFARVQWQWGKEGQLRKLVSLRP